MQSSITSDLNQKPRVFGLLKRMAISTGTYRPARIVYRMLDGAQSLKFRQEVAFYSKLLLPGSLCFDAGANIGEKTEAFLQAGASVVAFEPQPDCLRELTARCRHYGKRLRTCQTVLGEKRQEIVLHLRESSGQASLLEDWRSDWQTAY